MKNLSIPPLSFFTAALFLVLGISSSSYALPNDLTGDELARSVTRDYNDRLGALFTHFHRNPELSFMETKTAKKLAEELRKSGFKVIEKVGGKNISLLLVNLCQIQQESTWRRSQRKLKK